MRPWWSSMAILASATSTRLPSTSGSWIARKCSADAAMYKAKRTGRSTYRFFSADVVYIQITVFNTRTAEQKKAPFKRTAELLGKNPGIRPEDVFIIVLDAAKENWSVGNGLAQFA